MKKGDQEAAARVFQKILELDPENTAMQSKLADLYIKLGKKEDARNIYWNAAQSLYAKGSMDGANEALERVLGLDPGNSDALLLRGLIPVKRLEEAGACASKLLTVHNDPGGLSAYAEALLVAGDYEPAFKL